MNAALEQDLERLDEYLDGALDADEAGRLRARLTREPGLAAVLEELESHRTARAAVWTSLESSDAQVEKFARRVTTAARRQEARGHVRRYARFGSAAAACLLVGYFVGWAGQSRNGLGLPSLPGGQTVNPVSQGGSVSGGHGGSTLGRYRVHVGFDERGRPITQDFESFEKAQRFADEVQGLHESRQGNPIIIREQL